MNVRKAGRAIRAVIFDLDGVLIDSADCHRAAFEEIFRPFGIGGFDYARYAGWRTADVVESVLRASAHTPEPELVRKMASDKSRIARAKLAAANPVEPDCVAVLEELSHHYALALASSGSRQSVELFLAANRCANIFGSVLSGDDVEHAKPAPEIYVGTFEALGIAPSDGVIIEDAVAGILAAKGAGAGIVIGFGTNSEAGQLLSAGADFVIQSLSELPALLRSNCESAIPLEIDNGNWLAYAGAAVDPASWTAVIPAAGRGSRLGYDRPKILYPIAGRPVLSWLLDFLEPSCHKLVFVVSPDGLATVRDELERMIPSRYDIKVQEVPTGMGDAVELALDSVGTRNVVVVWGDQVALRRSSVEACMRLHAGPLEADVACPTVFRDNPYIHFDRDQSGQICALRQAREGDSMPERGESDTGFFCFRTEVLRSLFEQQRRSPEHAGTLTREFNLLPVIPRAAKLGLSVITPRLMTLEETVGVNSTRDAAFVEAFLQNSHACNER
jgi:bifunctional UDP-N-acetylglucosamine pyrophosphorylase/glucosamine-1-phosphate N-acetyltransferase